VACTVLVVDDHPSFRRLAGRLLEDGGFEVVGEAADARSALAAADALQPDVVLLDVLLPDESGLVVARRLAERDTPPIVVLTSTRSESDLGSALSDARATAFVAKSELTPRFLRSVVEG
jgi:CheY-like chemotaxis protein